MKKELKDFLNTTYKMKSLIRYNNTPRLVDESIAEHQYFVALIVYKLYDDYKFDMKIALQMSLFHDIPEIMLSDVPSNTKRMFPEISDALRKNQKKASDMIDSTMTPLIEDYENLATDEALVVHLADILSIIQYTTQEVHLGNRYMEPILKSTTEMIEDLFKKMEGIKR